jgi:L-lactate dehydrogenase
MKIGIVGAGQVGATAAYSMMMRRVSSGILIVDRNADLAVAQARHSRRHVRRTAKQIRTPV